MRGGARRRRPRRSRRACPCTARASACRSTSRASRSTIRRSGRAPGSTWSRRTTTGPSASAWRVGRAFTEQDRDGAVRVAIVNDTFVKKYLAGVDPLSQRLVIEQLIPGVTKLGPAVEWQIVGVYNGVRNGGPRTTASRRSTCRSGRARGPDRPSPCARPASPTSMQQSLAAVIRSLDPDLPMADVKTMDQLGARIAGGQSVQHRALRQLRGRAPCSCRGRASTA